MKTVRKLCFLLAVILTLSCCLPTIFVAADEKTYETNPGIISGNAVVAFARDENRFLYNYRLDERVAPAVATKLMTCIVVADILQERGLKAENVKVTVTDEAIALSGGAIDARLPTMSFRANEQYTAQDLISATLVACANDAASALASYFGTVFLNGNANDFVAKMNEKAQQLGLKNTHFTNPTGLDDPNQYTTPREVALIASSFYGYNDLFALSNVESFTFDGKSTIRNKNALKSDKFVSGYKNPNAMGMIGGQLNIDGNYCLISATEKEGKTYIFVVMCASSLVVYRDEAAGRNYYSFDMGNAYDDMNKLIGWTRESFELVSITTKDSIIGELHVDLGNSSDHAMVVPAESVESLIHKSSKKNIKAVLTYDDSIVYKKEFNGQQYDTVNAPIETGAQVGEIVYTCDGVELARVPAVIKEGIELDEVKNFFAKCKAFLFGPIPKILGIVIGVIILIYIIAGIVSAVAASKEKKAKKNKKTQKTSVKPTNKSKEIKTDKNGDTKEMR